MQKETCEYQQPAYSPANIRNFIGYSKAVLKNATDGFTLNVYKFVTLAM